MNLPTMIKTRFNLPAWVKPRSRIDLMDYPIRTYEKLRFADTDRNGHISNAVFAVCCQNARMEILHDRVQVPLSIDAQFVIARLELEFLGEQSLFVGTRCVASARSIVVLIDRSTRRATPLPLETATALRALADARDAVASARRAVTVRG